MKSRVWPVGTLSLKGVGLMRRWMVFAVPAVLVVALMFAQKEKVKTQETWVKIAPAKDNKIFEHVLEYRRMGDFEHAVAAAIEPVNGKPPDDFLLQTAAVTYFQRAQADQTNKEKWVELAIHYSKRALEADPDDLVNIFNVGDSYMAAGMNLGKPAGCSYYEESFQTFDRLKANPGLQGEWGTIEGERVQLEPYRQKLEEHMKNLQMLARKCPGF
jgi:tetratricopeptide (TPR) repeat protein